MNDIMITIAGNGDRLRSKACCKAKLRKESLEE